MVNITLIVAVIFNITCIDPLVECLAHIILIPYLGTLLTVL